MCHQIPRELAHLKYILCNMKSSSCTQPFTEYMVAEYQSIIYRTFLRVFSPNFKIVVLRKMTLKFKKWYTCYNVVVNMCLDFPVVLSFVDRLG